MQTTIISILNTIFTIILIILSPIFGLFTAIYLFVCLKIVNLKTQIISLLALGGISLLSSALNFNLTNIYKTFITNLNTLINQGINGYLTIAKDSIFLPQNLPNLYNILALIGLYFIVLAIFKYTTSNAKSKKIQPALTHALNVNSQISLGTDSNTSETVTVSHQELNQHMLVIGTTGSGKTNTLMNIVKSCCEQNLPLVYLDGKGGINLAEKIANFCKEYKRTLKVFSVDPNPNIPGLSGYNPLAFGNFTQWQNKIMTLLGEAENKGQEHYLIKEQDYINVVCEVLNKSGKYIDLEALLAYLNHPEELQKLANNINPQLAARLLKATPRQTEASDIVKLLGMFYHSHYGDLFSTSKRNKSETINLQEALNNNEIVLFLFDAASFQADTSALGKLVINDINAAFSDLGRSSQKTTAYCIFDEFAAYTSSNMANILSMQRANGLHAIIGTQSINAIAMDSPQIKRVAVELIANCNTFIIHKINDPEDIRLLSNVIGKEQIYKTNSINYTDFGETRISNAFSEDYILDAKAVRNLNVGYGYLYQSVIENRRPRLVKFNPV